MTDFTLYDETTAPKSTKETLAEVRKTYGMIPNLYGYLAESPVALSAYITINDQLMNHSSLTPAHVQVALLAISDVNNCEFCVAAHSWVSSKVMANPQTVAAIREGGTIEDPQDKVLVHVVRAIVSDRGHVADEILQAFFAAGFTKQNLFDLLVCNMLKSLSNYTNHITNTEVNEEFKGFAR